MATAAVLESPAQELELHFGLGDAVLRDVYVRWHAERLFRVIFHSDVDMTLDQFIDWHRQPGMRAIGCVVSNLGLVGIGYINRVKQVAHVQVAEVGIGFFRKIRPPLPEQFGHRLVEHAFRELGYACLYGVTPAPNRNVGRYVQRLGFHPTGVLPLFTEWHRAPADAALWAIRREEWQARQQ